MGAGGYRSGPAEFVQDRFKEDAEAVLGSPGYQDDEIGDCDNDISVKKSGLFLFNCGWSVLTGQKKITCDTFPYFRQETI